ncbi:hypothetical protein BU23DRAFT_552597 [Bimuria novae-zelandiae CBS 107.79]|uniref:BZIP domain-containing protein n=1 Tax=Bimuria novae-zelandiae CBS 107.79 TaxID=1447943 RepID=A0A6A5VH45_9PLEO|nr:hypothetical protein BU23DRAFT_552597 [Bimuria novae-zelandiae CBS 107.79]
MARKSNDTPSSTRIRDNQRRSRTRRAELLHDLQKRVQEYERQGVAATLEMQRAARKVVQENARLRALLALRGVSSEEVESFLRSSEEASTLEANLPSFQEPSMAHQHQAPEQEDNGFFKAAESSHQTGSRYVGHEPTRADPQLVMDRTENHNAAGYDDSQGHRDSNDSNFPCTVIEPSDCPSTLDCFCAPPPVSEYHPASSQLEISCEAAAAVIANMRGHGDRESIRASLGCRGQEHCTIKNSTVLQIMDEG